jgi:hypothetical protein
MWRWEAHITTNLERTVVLRDNLSFEDFTNEKFAILRKSPPPEPGDPEFGNQTALDLAKKEISFGQTDIPSTARILDHEPVQGRATYVLSFVRPTDNYHAEILVDKETNLPIQSDLAADDTRPGFKGYKAEVHTDFTFNQPLDPKLFSLESSKPIIRPEIAAQELKKRWSTPVGTVKNSDLLEVTVSPDGTVWVASTVHQDGKALTLPTSLTNARGTKFFRIGDLEASHIGTNFEVAKAFGNEVYITGFVPPRPDASQPGPVSIGFGERGLPQNYVPALPIEEKVVSQEFLSTTPQSAPTLTPPYFPQLCIQPLFVQVNQMVWGTRARNLEAEGDFLGAAKSYDEWAKARYQWVKYSAFDPMLEAARCYRKLGLVAKADSLTKQAEALKASRER